MNQIQNYEYIDFHTHMHDDVFDNDRSEVLEKIKNKNIAFVTIGTDLETSKKAKDLSDQYPNVFYTIGIHPNDRLEAEFVEEEFEKLLGEKCIAIGECGLEYFTFDNDIKNGNIKSVEQEKERQENIFRQQIDFAIKNNLPLMIHGRPKDGDDVYADILKILKEYINSGIQIKANMHFFAGSMEIAKECIELGFTFSFGGVLTVTHDYDEVVKYIPIEYIHAETDSPYVMPRDENGNRVGEKINGMYRNSSEYVNVIVQKIAEIKNLDIEFVKEKLKENFIDFI